jgi:hypothetical protein|tara:strand:- start:4111 stop:4266 length:156 start_codon:yes stop_codon:yes gene_type:complete
MNGFYLTRAKVVKTNQNYFKIRFVKVKTLCIFAQRFTEVSKTLVLRIISHP